MLEFSRSISIRAVATYTGCMRKVAIATMVTTDKHEGKDQPLMLPQYQQIVVKVRLSRRQLPRREIAGAGINSTAPLEPF